jgi:phosphoribosylformimino-5-aminoimidazole carboxamide ribotide isomerase
VAAGTRRSLLIVPAIDLRSGRCVRLLQGRFDQTSVYDVDPVAQAARYALDGARLLHVVDLDAAEGRGKDNRSVIRAIREAVGCAIEVGGGIRTEADVHALIDLGIDRLVVGTALARGPDEVARWSARWGRRLVAGIDARDGRAKVAGWTADGGASDVELAAAAARAGLAGIIYTSIARDGTLAGPDVERTNLVARATGLPTILSGGVASAGDVAAVAEAADERVVGVILGKALDEGTVELAALLASWPQQPAALAAGLPAGR